MLRLGHCALNVQLHRINCASSPFCECRWSIVKTFYIVFDMLLNEISFTSARLFHPGYIWINLSENKKIEILLHGSENLGDKDNLKLMRL